MEDAHPPLTVGLERVGGVLARSYWIRDHKLHESTASWTTLGNGFRFAEAQGLDAIARLLDRGKDSELVEHFSRSKLAAVGEILFEALFGQSAEWEPIFRSVFGKPDGPRPNPIFGKLRLRVCTADPDLLGMPWRATTWQGRRLVEGLQPWTFEVSDESRPSRVVHFPMSARLLVIAPEISDLPDLGTAGHVAQLREATSTVTTRYAGAQYLRVVKTQEDLLAGFRGISPHVVYYYGHAEVIGGQTHLLLPSAAGARTLNMDDFRRMMQPLPLAVFVNGCMSGASGWHSAGYKLSPDVPVVVANRTTAWTGRAGPAAIKWLQELLRGAGDPVALLDTIDAAESTQGFQWATTIVHTGYHRWMASTVLDEEPRPVLGLRLDRMLQRTTTLGQVSGLTQSRMKRVEAIVAYGEPGNHVAQVGDQLIDYLETHGMQIARVKRLRLRFPESRARLLHGLEDGIRAALRAGPDDVLQYALRGHLPGADASRPTPLLWIDWGTFGPGAQQTIKPMELADWLTLASTILARECPAECRIVCFLAMEIGVNHHQPLEKKFNSLREDLTADKFGCQLLPKLHGLERIDIYEYLRDPRNTSCPSTLAKEMAKLLHDATHGNYEATVALIREAEQTTWLRLADKLRNLSHAAPSGEEEWS